jgi:hypothetical protein
MTTAEAYNHMKAAMAANPDYAWSWHCNIARPLIDSGIDGLKAQQCAARLMKHFWGVDTSANKHYASVCENWSKA